MADRLAGKRALIYGGGTGHRLRLRRGDGARGRGGVHFQPPQPRCSSDATAKLASTVGKAGFAAGDATAVEDVQRVTAAGERFMGGIDTLVVSARAPAAARRYSTPIPRNSSGSWTTRCGRHSSRCATPCPDLLAAGKASVIVISSTLGPRRAARTARLLRRQGGRHRHGQGHGAGPRRPWRAGQCHLSRASSRRRLPLK